MAPFALDVRYGPRKFRRAAGRRPSLARSTPFAAARGWRRRRCGQRSARSTTPKTHWTQICGRCELQKLGTAGADERAALEDEEPPQGVCTALQRDGATVAALTSIPLAAWPAPLPLALSMCALLCALRFLRRLTWSYDSTAVVARLVRRVRRRAGPR